MRAQNRNNDQLRNISIQRQYLKDAEGSVLVSFGETKVICTASVNIGVPPFLKDSGRGWVTAEYGMLPRSTPERMQREAARGKQSGRTQEIQRLIGRSLRACVDMKAMGENTIVIDCDVIQADGGTRTASITGGCVALYDALQSMVKTNLITTSAFKQFVAGISVGVKENVVYLDLDYSEDTTADTDMNIVMTEKLEFIEVQGTAENQTFTETTLMEMLKYAKAGILDLIKLQKQTLNLS